MLCPSCQEPLVIVEVEAVELDLCPRCRGTWFDAQEVGLLFEAAGTPDRCGELERRLAGLPSRALAAKRRCPRCRRKMQEVEAPARPAPVVIDRCPRGDGLWLDAGEMERILDAEIAADIPGLDEVRGFLLRFAAPRH